VRPRSLIAGGLAIVVAAVGLGAALLRLGDREAPARAATTATATTTAASPAPITADEALEAIGTGDVMPHLDALARAAGEAGTRAAGTPGDEATRTYVADTLRAAGWRVTVQEVRFPYFDERRPPRVVPTGGAALREGRDVRTIAYSSGGRASGAVRGIGGGPDAGCSPGDFAGLRDGEIALVQRGTCTMRVKARNAQDAGAAAIVIANDGGPGRTDAIAGTLGEPGLGIPAVFVSTAAGQELGRAGRATIDVDAVSEQRRTANVLAETGDGERVAMAGAHLDSVADGPGINDDGSGVAALLAAAEALGGRTPDGVRLRLGFWGAEELGLHGSRHYVAGLDGAEREAIDAYVNLDMVGTEGGEMAVYRGDDAIRGSLRRGLTARGHEDIGVEALGASSDHAPFARAGIPIGGIFTGLDRCYHRACDDSGNVDPELVADAGAATAATLLELRTA
jgi:aminopeptidase Y